jgi:glutaredoxin 2
MYRQDDEDLVDKYNRPNVPMLQTNPVKDWVIDAGKTSQEFYKDAVSDPKWALGKIVNSAENAVLYLRNKNIWFGAGLNARDFERYNGALQDSQGLAIASVALDNAISSGNIGVQVVMQGGLKFDNTHKRFVATQTPLGMVGVYKAQAELKKKLGDQLGENIIQGYLEAKRSKSIKDEYAVRAQEYKDAVDAYNRSLQQPDVAIQLQAKEVVDEAAADLASIKIALDKVNMSDEEIQEFIAREQEHPELRTIMRNWTAINQNLLKVWKQVGLLSDKRYDVLSQIPDYVPWYRIMSDDEDVHSPIQSTTKTLQNIGREKIFKEGKSRIVSVFTAEANQKAFEVQPSAQISVKVNGKNIPASKISSTPDGQVTLNIVINAGDQVVITSNREIENIIDNMTQNVMRMTMNAVRQYAASRIVSEYGTRNAKGQIMQFKSVDPNEGKFYFVSKGRRIIVQIQDPLVAEAVFGMKTLDIEMFGPLVAVANLTRRLITISPTFQLKQIFQDAPTAALVSGVKNPAALMGGVFNGFVQSLRPSDPIAQIFRSAGIGGFYSPARTPEAEVKRRIGVLNNNVYDYVMRALDHWGDASDMAQRRAIYIRVLKETGDANLALYQAANVINFLHRGSGRAAQFVTKTVPFMAAYANQIDVLAQTLLTGGLKGMDRKRAAARLAKTGTLLMGMTLLYCFAVGDDEEYIKLDDQTRIRNFIIPGTTYMIPMNTAAAYFFKAIPEMLYNKVIREGTDREIDMRRMAQALSTAAKDLLLGPNPLPSGVKTVIEIGLNKDFWSGRDITPKRLQDVEAAEQYTASTSELGKKLSKLSGGVLNPMEMDHIVRSTFGAAGALAQYFTNLIGEAEGVRAETPLKQTPLVGPFTRPEVPRGPEDLFYDLKKKVDTAYNTLGIKEERLKGKEAATYDKEKQKLIGLHDTLEGIADELKDLNKNIREAGEAVDKSRNSKQKRDEMNMLMEEKNKVLDDIELLRKEAGFSEGSKVQHIIDAILNR